MPSGTYVNALVATFTTTGSSVFVGSNSQVSGVNQNDFNNPVTYSVDTPNSPTSSYTVKVTGGVFTSGNAVIKSFDASKCALVSSGNYTSCFANAVGDFSLTAGGCTLSKSNQYLSLQKSGSSTFTGLLDGSTNANIVSDGTSHMAISGGFNLDITTLSISANGMSVNPTTYQVLSTVCP